MADYSPTQKVFITKMNQVDAQHRAAAQDRNARAYGAAPRAIGGKVQARSPHGPALPKPKKVTVKKHTRTLQPQAPAAPGAPAQTTDQMLINAAVRSRFAPQEQALNQGLAQNARFTSGLGDWYASALNEIKGLRDQGNASAQRTLGQITQYNSQPTLANANDQQAATARNNLNSEFASAFGQGEQGNNEAMNRLAAAYLIQQGNTQNQANRDRQNLIAQQGQLGQQKADYGLTYGSQLAQSQTKALTDQAKLNLAAKALGVKIDTLKNVQEPLAQSLIGNRANQQKVARSGVRLKKAQLAEKTAADQASIQAKTDAAWVKAQGTNQTNAQKRSEFMAKYGLSPEKVAKMTPGQLSNFAKKNPQFSGYARPAKGSQGKPLTVAQAKGRQSIMDSITRYQTGVKHSEPLHKIANDGRGHNVSEGLLHAGADAVSHGFITPATVTLLKQLGFSVPVAWTKRGAFPVTYKVK